MSPELRELERSDPPTSEIDPGVRLMGRAALMTATALAIAEVIYAALFWKYRVVVGPRDVQYDPDLIVPAWKFAVAYAPLAVLLVLLGLDARKPSELLTQAVAAVATMTVMMRLAYALGDMALGGNPTWWLAATAFATIVVVGGLVFAVREFHSRRGRVGR